MAKGTKVETQKQGKDLHKDTNCTPMKPNPMQGTPMTGMPNMPMSGAGQ